MIDDEITHLSCMEITLIDMPYFLITLSDSKIAFEYIKINKNIIDLIILDLYMPDVTGLELLEQLKNDKSLKEIPVILQSATANDNDIIAAYKFGIRKFLQKPYNKKQVLFAIKAALSII